MIKSIFNLADILLVIGLNVASLVVLWNGDYRGWALYFIAARVVAISRNVTSND